MTKIFALPADYDELVKMIEVASGSHPSDEDVMWFVAYNVSQDVFGNMSTKDLARVLCEGGMQGITNKDDVDNWLDNLYPFTIPRESLDEDDKRWMGMIECDFFTNMMDFYSQRRYNNQG